MFGIIVPMKLGLLFVLMVLSVFAADGTAIEGSVLRPDGSPVRGAVIQFVRLDRGQGVVSVKTNRVGHFGYYGLNGGRYDVKAFAPDGAMIGEQDHVVITGVPRQFDFVDRSDTRLAHN